MVLVMSFGNKCGGRGQCRYCGQWENNVAYHEAHDCLEARRIQEAREQAYLEMLDEKKDTPKPIKSQTLNEIVSDFLGEDKHEVKRVPAPTFKKIPKDELDKLFEDFFNDKPSKPETDHECQYDSDGGSCPKCGKTAVEIQFPKELGNASYLIPGEISLIDSTPKGLHFKCNGCKQPLTKPGAILFSPPRKNGNSDIVTKFHLCQDCYELCCDVSGFNYE
jgi:hypothetical protein